MPPTIDKPNSFEAYLAEKSTLVNPILEETVNVIREPPVKLLDESMRYSLTASSSTKRALRASICIAACELVGGEESSAVLAASVVEMIHIGTCVIADLPRVHNNKGLRWQKPANHEVFGESIAVLSGFALVAHAVNHLVNGCTKLGVPWDRIVRAVGELTQLIGSDGLNINNNDDEGMLERVNESVNGHNLHKPEVELEASLVLGAILGGAEDQEIGRVREFGRCIGPLFHLLYEDGDVAKSCNKSHVESSSVDDAKSHLAPFDPHKTAPLIALVDCLVSLAPSSLH